MLPREYQGDVTDEQQDDDNLEKVKVFSDVASLLEVFHDAVENTEADKNKQSRKRKKPQQQKINTLFAPVTNYQNLTKHILSYTNCLHTNCFYNFLVKMFCAYNLGVRKVGETKTTSLISTHKR